MQRRDAPATKSSGCLSEANPKGRKGPRDAEFYKLYQLFPKESIGKRFGDNRNNR